VDDRHIGKRIRIISNQIRRKIERESSNRGVELSSTQSRIIGYLYRESKNRDIFQKDIEEEFDIRRSSVTSILQHLERNGYITRESVANDGRLKKLVLTEKGIGIHEMVFQVIQEVEGYLNEDFSGEELDVFLNLLDRVSKKLNTQQ
jgi:DNA-binding MarR family transcriptional regulator